MERLWLVLWLSVAALSQVTLSLYGMLSRYLMILASPPIPPLRLVLLMNVIAEACLLAAYSLPAYIAAWRPVRTRKRSSSTSSSSAAEPLASRSAVSLAESEDMETGAVGVAQATCPPKPAPISVELTNGAGSHGLRDSTRQVAPADASQQPKQQQEQPAAGGGWVLASPDNLPPAAVAGTGRLEGGGGGQQCGLHHRAAHPACNAGAAAETTAKPPSMDRAAGVETTVMAPARPATAPLPPASPRGAARPPLPQPGGSLAACGSSDDRTQPGSTTGSSPPPPALPDLPLRRGLSRRFDGWCERRPVWHRALTVATLTLSFLGVYAFQAVAPGYVDASLPQLVMQFSVLCVALTQSLLLHRRLPLYTWPCAGAMVGGASMIIVPNLGQSTAGSLNTPRGWLGFGLSLASLASSVVYLVVIQATRHLRLSSELLTHAFFLSGSLLFAALSLPLDGAGHGAWARQLGPWGAGDWVVLVTLGTVCYVGSAVAIQHCVWRLGAPTTAMFFGLRLVCAAALSPAILGASIIQTPVQIAGVAVTTGALTVYMGFQWRQSRQAAEQAPAPGGSRS